METFTRTIPDYYAINNLSKLNTIFHKRDYFISINPTREFKTKLEKLSYGLIDGYFPFENCCIAGGSLNFLFDNSLDFNNPLFCKSDIDVYLYNSIIPKKIINYLIDKYGHHNVYIANTGYLIQIWITGISKSLQLIRVSDYSPHSIINQFDYSHVKCFYDGSKIVFDKRFLNAVLTKTTILNMRIHKRNGFVNDSAYLRIYKTIQRGYKIINDETNAELEINLENLKTNKKVKDYIEKPFIYPKEELTYEENINEIKKYNSSIFFYTHINNPAKDFHIKKMSFGSLLQIYE